MAILHHIRSNCSVIVKASVLESGRGVHGGNLSPKPHQQTITLKPISKAHTSMYVRKKYHYPVVMLGFTQVEGSRCGLL